MNKENKQNLGKEIDSISIFVHCQNKIKECINWILLIIALYTIIGLIILFIKILSNINLFEALYFTSLYIMLSILKFIYDIVRYFNSLRISYFNPFVDLNDLNLNTKDLEAIQEIQGKVYFTNKDEEKKC